MTRQYAPMFVKVGICSWERGEIGIRSGLKIRHLRVCGFESHRSYQNFEIP